MYDGRLLICFSYTCCICWNVSVHLRGLQAELKGPTPSGTNPKGLLTAAEILLFGGSGGRGGRKYGTCKPPVMNHHSNHGPQPADRLGCDGAMTMGSQTLAVATGLPKPIHTSRGIVNWLEPVCDETSSSRCIMVSHQSS